MRRSIFASVIVLFAVLVLSGEGTPQLIPVPEIPDPFLGDISVARIGPFGPEIRYNPALCNALGPYVCGFFRAHEYGHVVNGDTLGLAYISVAEANADCWAASHIPTFQATVVANFFHAQGPAGDYTHQSGYVREARVRLCAGIP